MVAGSIIDSIIKDKLEQITYAVYEYIEIETGLVRYIGIVNNGTIANRHRQHTRDSWYKSGDFKIRYIQCNNQSETEAIEAHLISLYPDEQLYNKAKKGWGINKYLPNEYEWKDLNLTYDDLIQVMKNKIYYSKSEYVNNKIVQLWIDLCNYIRKSSELQPDKIV